MHNHSHRIRSIDNIYYSYTSKTKKDWMMLTLDNGISIRIDDFGAFKESVFSQTGESPEEVLNNILDLVNNESI